MITITDRKYWLECAKIQFDLAQDLPDTFWAMRADGRMWHCLFNAEWMKD